MSNRIRLALIGRGHWGRVYQKNIQELPLQTTGEETPSIEIPYIWGRDYKEEIGTLHGNDVTGAIIAASTAAHYEIAVHLLQQGIRHLLIEKPLTRTYAEAKDLCNLAATVPNSILMVDHTLLYDPAYNAMKDMAASTIGNITQVHYTSLKTPPIEGPTIIPDAGSPPLYLFLDIAQGKPKTVSARPTMNDNVELTLEFEHGVRMIANIGSIYPTRKREIVFVGERGNLTLTEFMNPRELLYTDTRGTQKRLSFKTDRSPLQLAILEFVHCISNNKKPRTPLATGVEVVRVIERAEESLKRSGEPLSL